MIDVATHTDGFSTEADKHSIDGHKDQGDDEEYNQSNDEDFGRY
jgi:hypothetical protein